VKSPVLAQRAVSEDPRWTRAVGDLIRVILVPTYTSKQGVGGRVRLAPSPLVAPLPRRSERKPSGIPSVAVVPTVILQSVPAFLLRTPGGAPPLRRMSRAALGHLKGEKDLSQDLLQGVHSGAPLPRSAFAPPVMFAKPKGIPVDRRDFPSRKGYPRRDSSSHKTRSDHDNEPT
jgi:hypothetical protein